MLIQLAILTNLFSSSARGREIVADAALGLNAVYTLGGCAGVDESAARAAFDRQDACATSGHHSALAPLAEVANVPLTESEDRLFQSLGAQHAKELKCAADFGARVKETPSVADAIAAKFEALRASRAVWIKSLRELRSDRTLAGRGCPTRLDELDDNDVERFRTLCSSVITAKATFESVEASIPLIGSPAVKRAAEEFANRPSADPARPSVTAVYDAVATQLRAQAQSLRTRAESRSGGQFTPDEKSELMSEPAIVNQVIKFDAEPLGPVACRADARYGRGRVNLVTTLNVATIAFGGGAFAVAKGAAWLTKMGKVVNTARATGQISGNAVNILKAGAVAATLGTVATDISHICRHTPWQQRTGGDACVAAPTIARIESDGCVLAATLTGLNAASVLPASTLAMLMIPGRIQHDIAGAKQLTKGPRDFLAPGEDILAAEAKTANQQYVLTSDAVRANAKSTAQRQFEMHSVQERAGFAPNRKQTILATKKEAQFLRDAAIRARTGSDPNKMVDDFLESVGAHPSVRAWVKQHPHELEVRSLRQLIREDRPFADSLKRELGNIAAASAKTGVVAFADTARTGTLVAQFSKDADLVAKQKQVDELARTMKDYNPREGRNVTTPAMMSAEAHVIEAPLACTECVDFPNGDVSFRRIYVEHVKSHGYGLDEAARFRQLEVKLAGARTEAEKTALFAEMKTLGIVRPKSATSFSLLHDDIDQAPQLFARGKNIKKVEFETPPGMINNNPNLIYTFDASTEITQGHATRTVNQKYRIVLCNALPGEKCTADGVKFERGDVMTFLPECGEFVLRSPSAKSLSAYYTGGPGKQREYTLERALCP